MSALLVPMTVAVLIQLLLSIGLLLWARWVARRQRGRWWRWGRWLPLVALGLAIVGAATSTTYLLGAFDAVQRADPAVRATLLAKSISEAMNTAAFLSLPSWLLYAASLVTSLVGSILRPKTS